MITVKFWNFAKRENSTKIPTTTGTSFNCDIKTENTITELSIELNVGSSVHPTYTYCYVQDFARYYFIRNWKWDRGVWIAECEVDVLASFKTQIGNQSMYVSRSSSQYDGHVLDESYPLKTNVSESTTYIENSYNPYGTRHAEVLFYEGVIVLGVVGTNADTASTIYYQMSVTTFIKVLTKMLTAVDGYDFGDLTQGIWNSIVNPLDYIVSCRWYPYPFEVSSATVSQLAFGLWVFGNVDNVLDDVKILRNTDGESDGTVWRVALPKHPLASSRGAYLNSSKYSDYYVDWGGLLVQLNSDYLVDADGVDIGVCGDFTSGQGIITITSYITGLNPKSKPIVISTIPYGVDIPLKQSSTSPLAPLGALGGLILAGAGVSSLAVASEGLGNINSALTTAGIGIGGMIGSASKLNGRVISQGSMGNGYIYSRNPKFLHAVFRDVCDENNTEFGRPLMTTKTISTLSGYIKCENSDTQIDCLADERDKIASYMTGGFFYE